MKFTSTKFTFSTTSTIAALMLLSSMMASVQGDLSPYVTCCTQNGGHYGTITDVDGSESGFCKKEGQNLSEVAFFNQYCVPPPTASPSPTDYEYKVYAVNNCRDTKTVKATFDLNGRSSIRGKRRDGVEVDYGKCRYVGGTNLDSVTYTSKGSYVSGGNESCYAIQNSNDDKCKMVGMASNSCVIELC